MSVIVSIIVVDLIVDIIIINNNIIDRRMVLAIRTLIGWFVVEGCFNEFIGIGVRQGE